MRISRVTRYDHLVSGLRSGSKYSIVKFVRTDDYRTNILNSSLAKRKDMNVDVYSVDYFENFEVARLYGVVKIPTAIFMENGVPMSRMTGIEYAEEFLDYVNGVVVGGKYPLTSVSNISNKTPDVEQTFLCEPWMRQT
jgi:hypothetical protein